MRAFLLPGVLFLALASYYVSAYTGLKAPDICSNSPPKPCLLTNWSEWTDCFPSCLQPGVEPSGMRNKMRWRGVLQQPCPEAPCPPDGPSMREYQVCPDKWCTANNMACIKTCQGCQYANGYEVLSDDWCRCCANQSPDATYYAANPCRLYGAQDYIATPTYSWTPQAVGCNYLPMNQGFSVYRFATCLNQGFCATNRTAPGGRNCNSYC